MIRKILDLISPIQPDEISNLQKLKTRQSSNPRKKLVRKPKNKIEKIQWSCLSVIGLVFLLYILTLILLEVIIIF